MIFLPLLCPLKVKKKINRVAQTILDGTFYVEIYQFIDVKSLRSIYCSCVNAGTLGGTTGICRVPVGLCRVYFFGIAAPNHQTTKPPHHHHPTTTTHNHHNPQPPQAIMLCRSLECIVRYCVGGCSSNGPFIVCAAKPGWPGYASRSRLLTKFREPAVPP